MLIFQAVNSVENLLVDGTHLAFRSFYAIKDLCRKDGFPTNALHGFVGLLWSLESHVPSKHKLIFFDCARSQKRLKILPTYKANRKETPDGFKLQLPWVKRLAAALGYHVFEDEAFEADDLIAAWAKTLAKEGKTSVIASADKDFGQCVCDLVNQVVPSNGSEWSMVDRERVHEKFGVYPEQMIDFLALTGDSIDNIDGVPGVGPKTAAQWIAIYGSLEKILQSLTQLKPERFRAVLESSREQLAKNCQLITLETEGVVQPETLKNLTQREVQFSELENILKEMELMSLLKRARERYIQTSQPTGQTEFLF